MGDFVRLKEEARRRKRRTRRVKWKNKEECRDGRAMVKSGDGGLR